MTASILTRRGATAVLAALGLGAALTAFSSAASAQSLADIKKKGEITIGMLVDFPPYGTTNAQNQPDGYDADVAKLLAKDWGVKANIVPVTGPNRIPFLLTNKVDLLVASLAVTPESHSGMLAGLQPRLRSDGQLSNVGGVVSTVQVMRWTQVAELPQPSVAV